MTTEENNILNDIEVGAKAYASTVASVGDSVTAIADMKNGSTVNASKYDVSPPTKENTRETKGEKAFNKSVYYGIGWGANSLISMIAADKIIHGSGQVPMSKFSMWTANKTEGIGNGTLKLKDVFQEEHNIWKQKDFLNARKMTNYLKDEYKDIWKTSQKESGKSVEGFYQKLEESIGKSELISSLKDKKLLNKEGEALTKEFESLSRASHVFTKRAGLLSFIALQVGGWITIVPIKLLEDKKVGITKWFDEKLNGNDVTTSEHKKISKRHEYLKVEPKQSWKSEIGSRALVQPLIVGFYLVTRGSKNILNKIGIDFAGTDAIMERNIDKVFSDIPKSGGVYKKIVDSFAKNPAKINESFSKLEEVEEIFEKSGGAKRFKDSIIMNGTLEAFYAGIIAVGTFVASRTLGPYFASKNNKENLKPVDKQSKIDVNSRAEKIEAALGKVDVEKDLPSSLVIDAVTIQHQGMSSIENKQISQ